jgi:hypothetical protein
MARTGEKSMRSTIRKTVGVLVLTALATAAVAAPPPHPLAGQTLDFIPSDSGDDADSVRLTVVSAEISNAYGGPNSRGEVDMQSDLGKDIIGFIRASGAALAATDILLKSQTPGAAKDAFSLAFKEHVVYRMGDNVGPALAAGFTFGLAAPATLPVTYVTEMTLVATRQDEQKSSWACEARVKGGAPRNYRPAPALWAKMYGEARDTCLSELLAKMKADQAFFRPS